MSSVGISLAECLSEMETGRSLDDCLARYGAQASELRALLTLSSDLRSIPVPHARPEAKAAQKQRMLAALEAKRTTPPSRLLLLDRLRAGLTIQPAFRWAAALAMVLVLLLSGGWASVTIADDSLPGDLLHPIKRAGEWVQISVAIDPVAKQQLREDFFWERLEETQSVLDLRRQTKVEFAGILTAVTDDFWQVEEFYVYLNSDTVILGNPELSRRVQVKAQAQNSGELVALRLQVEPVVEPGPRPNAEATLTPLSSPSPTPSPTQTPTLTMEEISGPAPTPSSTPAATPVRPADKPERELEPTNTPVPSWLQKFRRTPRPQSTSPMVVPSLTATPRERQRLYTRTPVPARVQPPVRTRQPEHTPKPKPEHTRMPEDPPPAKPERTREPEPERPRDPKPEQPRPRSTKRP